MTMDISEFIKSIFFEEGKTNAETETKKLETDSIVEVLCTNEEKFKELFNRSAVYKKIFLSDINYNSYSMSYFFDLINASDMYVPDLLSNFVKNSITKLFEHWINRLKYDESAQIFIYLLDITGMTNEEDGGNINEIFTFDIYNYIFTIILNKIRSIKDDMEAQTFLVLFDSLLCCGLYKLTNYIHPCHGLSMEIYANISKFINIIEFEDISPNNFVIKNLLQTILVLQCLDSLLKVNYLKSLPTKTTFPPSMHLPYIAPWDECTIIFSDQFISESFRTVLTSPIWDKLFISLTTCNQSYLGQDIVMYHRIFRLYCQILSRFYFFFKNDDLLLKLKDIYLRLFFYPDTLPPSGHLPLIITFIIELMDDILNGQENQFIIEFLSNINFWVHLLYYNELHPTNNMFHFSIMSNILAKPNTQSFLWPEHRNSHDIPKNNVFYNEKIQKVILDFKNHHNDNYVQFIDRYRNDAEDNTDGDNPPINHIDELFTIIPIGKKNPITLKQYLNDCPRK